MDQVREIALQKSVDYREYLRMIDEFVRDERTSGENQSAELAYYTKLNAKRIKRLNKTAIPASETVELISSLPFNMEWVVITEVWCGDAAQNIPYINKLAEACPNVNLRLVFRDENIEYMDRHLTNGSRSIPKLIVYSAAEMDILGEWGPRPETVQTMMEENKNSDEPLPYEQMAERLHGWYAKDKNVGLDEEIFELFSAIEVRLTV